MLMQRASEKYCITTCNENKCMSLSPSLCLFNKICSLHFGEFSVSEWIENDVILEIRGQTGLAIMHRV